MEKITPTLFVEVKLIIRCRNAEFPTIDDVGEFIVNSISEQKLATENMRIMDFGFNQLNNRAMNMIGHQD